MDIGNVQKTVYVTPENAEKSNLGDIFGCARQEESHTVGDTIGDFVGSSSVHAAR